MSEQTRVIGYVRVSTDQQNLDGQRAAILEYVAGKDDWKFSRFIEAQMSAKRSEEKRNLDELREAVEDGEANVVVFSELSRFGRSVSQLVRLVEEFRTERDCELHFVKQGITLAPDNGKNGGRDIKAEMTLWLFSIMAELESWHISERTKMGLEAARAKGVKLGRPAGKSKLDPHAEEIWELMDLHVPKKYIAEKMDCCQATLNWWLERHDRQERFAAGESK